MTTVGTAPRRAALRLLDGVLDEHKLMSELLGGPALAALGPEDKARAQRLATETLRSLTRTDAVLKPFLRKAPPLQVLNVLRLAAVELCVDGAAAHGVVNSAVEIVGANKRTASMKGLVNAVLRKVAAEGPAKWDRLPVPMLPRWLREPMIAAWSKPEVRAMEAVHFAGASLDLTAKNDAGAVAADVGGELLETGSVRLHEAGQVSGLPGFEAGAWWVQDAAAAMPVRILDPKPGEAVLDLCAAPGGKTMQIAAAGANVTAVDDSAGRMRRVEENLARTGLTADLKVMDARAVQGEWDAILLDAPCSATGTIRRHPDLPYAKDGSDFGALIALQVEMIDHAVSLLRPSGRLLFCTCSLLPDEGEVQIEQALERHPQLRADREALNRRGLSPDWITEEGGLRLMPQQWADIGGWDGFYIACLVKEG